MELPKGYRGGRFARSASWLAAFTASLLLGAVGAGMTQAPSAATAQVPDRARLPELQREAVSLLKRAAQADAPIDEVRRALLDAVQRLDALGAEPDPQGASEAAAGPRLTSAMRCELRRAARELAS